VSCEYVFKLGDGRPVIFAGPGSAQTFRDNFYYRLAEAFCNFERLYRCSPQQFPIIEYKTYEQFYLDLRKKMTGQIPMELAAAYASIKQLLSPLQQSR